MKRLGMDKLIGSRPSSERDLVFAMVAARIVDPDSILATTRWWKNTTLPEMFDATGAGEDELYSAMCSATGKTAYLLLLLSNLKQLHHAYPCSLFLPLQACRPPVWSMMFHCVISGGKRCTTFFFPSRDQPPSWHWHHWSPLRSCHGRLKGGFWIIDHKSDQTDDLELRFARYLPQLNYYADAVKSARPNKPVLGVGINWISNSSVSRILVST